MRKSIFVFGFLIIILIGLSPTVSTASSPDYDFVTIFEQDVFVIDMELVIPIPSEYEFGGIIISISSRDFIYSSNLDEIPIVHNTCDGDLYNVLGIDIREARLDLVPESGHDLISRITIRGVEQIIDDSSLTHTMYDIVTYICPLEVERRNFYSEATMELVFYHTSNTSQLFDLTFSSPGLSTDIIETLEVPPNRNYNITTTAPSNSLYSDDTWLTTLTVKSQSNEDISYNVFMYLVDEGEENSEYLTNERLKAQIDDIFSAISDFILIFLFPVLLVMFILIVRRFLIGIIWIFNKFMSGNYQSSQFNEDSISVGMRNIDLVIVFTYLITYSEFISNLMSPYFKGFEGSESFIGTPIGYIAGLFSFSFIAVMYNIVGIKLKRYDIVRIFAPAFLTIAIVDIIDYSYDALTTVGAFSGVLTIAGLIIYVPILSVMRLVGPVVCFLVFNSLAKSAVK